MAGARSEPEAGFFNGKISDRRFQALTVGLCADGSSSAFRSSGSALRKLGALAAERRIFFGRGSRGRRVEQANARAPHADGARKVSAVLFPKLARGARGASSED